MSAHTARTARRAAAQAACVARVQAVALAQTCAARPCLVLVQARTAPRAA